MSSGLLPTWKALCSAQPLPASSVHEVELGIHLDRKNNDCYFKLRDVNTINSNFIIESVTSLLLWCITFVRNHFSLVSAKKKIQMSCQWLCALHNFSFKLLPSILCVVNLIHKAAASHPETQSSFRLTTVCVFSFTGKNEWTE